MPYAAWASSMLFHLVAVAAKGSFAVKPLRMICMNISV